MTEPSRPAGRSALPPLTAEDHTCAGCRIGYADLTVDSACEIIAAVPDRVRAAVRSVPQDLRRHRPRAGTWSVVEYACHIRDVYATYTIRLHRTRTEDRPALEPMLNDLRAGRFRYNDRDLAAVLDEITANAAGFREEVAKVAADEWDRTATRLPGESRTARWMVRQAAHEGLHHARDIAAVGRTLDELG